MDETEIYIKMCEASEEIQTRRETLYVGDFVWRGKKYLYDTFVVDKNLMFKEEMVWLPRLDQLLDILHITKPIDAYTIFSTYRYNPDYHPYKTVEKLVLVYYMKLVHKKVWDNDTEKWVSDGDK